MMSSLLVYENNKAFIVNKKASVDSCPLIKRGKIVLCRRLGAHIDKKKIRVSVRGFFNKGQIDYTAHGPLVKGV